MKEKTLLHASQYIIPNSPEDMLNLAKAIAEKGKNPPAPDTLWWFGDDVTAFLEAWRAVHYR